MAVANDAPQLTIDRSLAHVTEACSVPDRTR